jgi:hypothetical protein
MNPQNSTEDGMIGALNSWAEELHVRANRVRQLIGAAHWLSDGHHKEYILAEFFARHLPAGLTVGRGFVRPPDPEMPVSREIDILITDPSIHPPWFREGGLTIAPPECVAGQIHVKTGFGHGEISDVIGGISETARLCMLGASQSHVWGGAFFYRQDIHADAIGRTLRHILNARLKEGVEFECLQCCLAVCGGLVVLIRRSPTNEELRIRVLKTGGVSAAILVAGFCDHLRAFQRVPHGLDALSRLLSRVDFPTIVDFSLTRDGSDAC